MHYERITLDEIKEAARGQGIGDLGEVQLCVLEPGGTFSFIKKEDAGSDDQPGSQPSDKDE